MKDLAGPKRPGTNSQADKGLASPAAQPTRIVADDFSFDEYLANQESCSAAMRRVTDKYNEILFKRMQADPVTVLQYAAVELANREDTIRRMGLPDEESYPIAYELSQKVEACLQAYRSMPKDPRFECEPSIQAFRRQIRLEGGMARLATAYQADLKAAYMSCCRMAYVALPFDGTLVQAIRPSVGRENIYRSNLIEGQFAVTGHGLLDYVLRAACGGGMLSTPEMSYFPASPVSVFKTDRKAVLACHVGIYEVPALEMDPEVTIDANWKDMRMTGVRFRHFDGEWTRKTRGLPDSMKLLPVLAFHVATFVPSGYFLKKAVRCGGPEGAIDLSALCRKSLDTTWQITNKVQ